MSVLGNLLRRPAPPVEVVALAIAHDAYPGLHVEHYLGEIDRLAADLREPVARCTTLEQRLALLRGHLHGRLRFRGNTDDYYDPRNSYLNDVIDRRLGIPISLAVILMAVGRRVGLALEGIGFPGHFLVRVGGGAGYFLDPFDVEPLDEVALRSLAAQVAQEGITLTSDHLRPVSALAMAERMLANLQHAHERRGDHGQALLVCDRLVEIADSASRRRDRGMHALALGSRDAALADLEAYLAAAPHADDAARVRSLLQRARARPPVDAN